MPRIVDYATLAQAIYDFAHRATLSAYVDYFIQGGEDRIYRKIMQLNEGEGIRLMEAPLAITIDAASGQAPIPTDYLAMKNAVLLNGAYESDIIMKEPQWIRARYRNTQNIGSPAYMARDVNSIFVGSIESGVLTVSQMISGSIAAGQPLFGPNLPAGVVIVGPAGPPNEWDVNFAGVEGDIDSTITIDSSVTIDNLSVSNDTMTTGGFIFAPFPDQPYSIDGTYYQRAAALTSSNTVTWMVSNIPFALLSACLAEVAKFLKDQDAEKGYMADMQDRLGDIIMADKAERYAGGSLVISAV